MTTLKELITDGKLKQATRDLRYSRQVSIELDNGIHADYYPAWHRETGADHLALMRPADGSQYGYKVVLESPDEWRAIGQAGEAELIATLKARFPWLFAEVPQYMERGTITARSNEYAERIGEPMASHALLSLLKERGMVRVPVLVYFTEPVDISLNRKKTKSVKQAKLYLFDSTAGRLCYSTRVKSRVARGFHFTDELAAKVEGIQELK